MKTQSQSARDEESGAVSGEAACLRGQPPCVHSALHSRHKVFSGNIGKGREQGNNVHGGDEVKSLFFFEEEWGEIREKRKWRGDSYLCPPPTRRLQNGNFFQIEGKIEFGHWFVRHRDTPRAQCRWGEKGGFHLKLCYWFTFSLVGCSNKANRK